jgi:hypothetical protein
VRRCEHFDMHYKLRIHHQDIQELLQMQLQPMIAHYLAGL